LNTDVRQIRLKIATNSKNNDYWEDFNVKMNLLRNTIAMSPIDIYVNQERPVSQLEFATLQDSKGRHKRNEPLGYILHSREFYGLNFLVNENTLLPRCDTETLIERALLTASKLKGGSGLLIADVGTGSGCLSVCLARSIPHAKVYAIDICRNALEIASLNFEEYGLLKEIIPLRSNILEGLPERVDLIVANLPYVKSSEIGRLNDNIKEYEPLVALDGGEDGLGLIYKLIEQAPKKLNNGGYLIFEIGKGQEKHLKKTITRFFPESKIDITQDLSGTNRIIALEYHRSL